MNPMDQGLMEQPMEQEAEISPDERELFEQIVAAELEFIHGDSKASIVAQLKEGQQDLGKTIGHITFTLVKDAAEQIKQAKKEADISMLLGVATEVIDTLIRLAQSIGLQVNPEQLREEAMMTALQAYIMTLEENPDEQEMAKELLAQFMQDGTAEEAATTLEGIAAKHKQPPQPNAMAQGVQQGLEMQNG